MTTDWKTIEQKYYMFCVRRQPIVIVRGEGTKVWDDVGKEYLDFTSGWAVNNIGHSHSKNTVDTNKNVVVWFNKVT